MFARCMDGHWFAVVGSGPGHAEPCPVDGSPSDAADAVVKLAARAPEDMTLAALEAAGLPPELLADVVVVEFPEGSALPVSLHPWFEGDSQPR